MKRFSVKPAILPIRHTYEKTTTDIEKHMILGYDDDYIYTSYDGQSYRLERDNSSLSFHFTLSARQYIENLIRMEENND